MPIPHARIVPRSSRAFGIAGRRRGGDEGMEKMKTALHQKASTATPTKRATAGTYQIEWTWWTPRWSSTWDFRFHSETQIHAAGTNSTSVRRQLRTRGVVATDI